MIVAYSEHDIERQTNSVVTVGTFDGVHLGHRAIIETVRSRAKALNARSVVITFNPHPREVVGRGPIQYLSTLEERLNILEQSGIDATLVLTFTYDFSRLQPHDFYKQYVVDKVGVKEVIVGYDHMFGRDREAGIEELQQIGKNLGFSTAIVAPLLLNGSIVSSSFIRELVQRGEVERAEKLLGRPYSLQGVVVKGDGRGAQLGFPTANVKPDHPNKLIPAFGVYFVQVEIGTQKSEGRSAYFGMLNIGIRPTFQTDHRQVVEVHIFDVNFDLYGTKVRIDFLKRLREEKKFSSKEELIAQLRHDELQCKMLIAELSKSHILS